jgi:hypothetical protein
MYNRGIPYSIRQRRNLDLNIVPQKKSFAQNAIDKIKGWFK